jgi:DNA mismatch endonuclease (patch repair protein)
MSRIRAKDTKPEMIVRKSLFSNGFRYKLHDKTLPGRPDLVFPKHKTVLFVHGCFWHGHHNCRYFVLPKTRVEWWTSKIERNKHLDRKNARKLRLAGWRVLTVFECQLKPKKKEATLSRISSLIRNNSGPG